MDDDYNRRVNAALDLLPLLTRATFLLARVDDLAYADIAWRLGIDRAEVQPRLADAVFAIGRALDGHTTIAMRVHGELLIWRGGSPAIACDAATGNSTVPTASNRPDCNRETHGTGV